MNTINSHSTVHVAVYEKTLPTLCSLKKHPDEPLADVFERVLFAISQKNNDHTSRTEKADNEPAPRAEQAHKALSEAPIFFPKYRFLFLGTEIVANSYGQLFGKLVDQLDFVAPDAVEKLEKMKARVRRYVARRRRDIHPYSPHLRTLKTKSGWYVSDVVGGADFDRGVQALCRAAGLKHNKDARWA